MDLAVACLGIGLICALKAAFMKEVAKDRSDVATDYRLDIEFDHYGADPEVMEEKAKDARNIELLEARLAQVPDDLITWFYLGSQHWVAGRYEAATEGFRRVTEYYSRDQVGLGSPSGM